MGIITLSSVQLESTGTYKKLKTKEQTNIREKHSHYYESGMSVDDKKQVEVIQAKRQAGLSNACKRLGLERSITEDDEKFNKLITNTALFYSDRHKV